MGVFGDHLGRPGVEESLRLASPFGVMAFHGGNVEKVTDVIADEVAALADCSLYTVTHDARVDTHVPSKLIDPAESPKLRRFLDHAHEVVALHGYGRERLRRVILLGGSHRALARHLAAELSVRLPEFEARCEIDAIPVELRGLHPDNPVNRAAGGGVQIELPPALRWNWDAREWSDHRHAGRAEQVDRFVSALAAAIRSWREGRNGPGAPQQSS